LFQTFSFGIFFFSNIKKEKKKQRKKNHREKNAKKGRSFPSSSRSALSLLVPTFALLFQTHSSSSQVEEKKRKTKKKNHGEKKYRKRKELTLSSRSTHSLLVPAFAFLFQTFSFGIFFFSSKKKRIKRIKKTIEKKKM
jgi:lipopolysaccharide export LptBFGC system permease protein LptF